MSRERLRVARWAVGAALVAATAVIAGALVVPGLRWTDGERALTAEKDVPPMLARHLDKVKETLPGFESSEGPGSAAEANFAQRAFPDSDIPLARIATARAAAATLQKRGFPKGKGRPGTWVSIGPSNAVYPFFPLRDFTNYVPNEYVAGGRTTAIALASDCVPGHCRLYAGPAGGGLWRTDNALTGQPSWTYLSTPFEINSIGSIALDPNDPTGNTLWVGTGEANACGSGCEAGVGLYKSTDGGNTWTGPLGKAGAFDARGVGTIVVQPGDPNTVYAASTRAIRGVSSPCCGGAVSLIPGAAKWGLYKSVDGGASWAFIHNGAATTAGCTGDATEANNGTPCSPRGVRRVLLDPSDPLIVYAASYARGTWRSNDGGATWTEIKASLNSAITTTRPELAVTPLPGGKTRMYIAEGHTNSGGQYSRLFRSDDVATGVPVFTDLTSSNPADPGYGSYNYCTGQCWYDNFVTTPPGHPDIVYLGGSYQYGETGNFSPNRLAGGTSNGRGVVLSTDAGVTFTDMNMDATDPVHPNGIHPDQHFLVVNPNIILGGTQDNGTWQSTGNPVKWIESMIGDGGQSGFDVTDPHFRFHTYAGAQVDVNFKDGDTADWNWIADPLQTEASEFYVPIVSDPKVSGTMYVGTQHAWRTKTNGVGAMSLDELRAHCNEWTGDGAVTCGDWVPLGNPAAAGRLTNASYGDRSGGNVSATERVTADTSTLWAATSPGRVFISKNADAEPASAVVFVRLDSLAGNDPNRYVNGIHVDPANPNRAWVSYSGFDATTPLLPGHIFEVNYDPVAGTATWTDRSYDFGDIPATDVVRDDATGDLYASTDFGVVRLAAGASSWTMAAPGMPNVEVAGLTIVPSVRKIYAATHGLSAWSLKLE